MAYVSVDTTGAWSKNQTIQLRGAAVEADGRGHNLLPSLGPQVGPGFPKGLASSKLTVCYGKMVH